ncbi:MAG TPA: hypothetical protein VJO13_13660 [Ktedonobacterales bacterium]|nr:hypothetical protein [Ktedonobacterales bacterium]
MAGASEHQPEQQAATPRASGVLTSRRTLPAWLSVVLVVLTCIGVLASTLVIWVEATMLDTDRFVALVAPVGSDPRVIESVSQYAADQVVTALDIQNRTANALPIDGRFLTGPLERVVHDFVQTRTADFLTSNQGQALWQAQVRRVHAGLVALLRGQTSTLGSANGALTVDLLPVLAATLIRLQQAAPGLIPFSATIPDLSAAQNPAQARQELAQALGVQLAPDFGVITLAQSDTLKTAQRIVSLLDALKIVLPLVTLALVILTLWVAADRRRTLLLLGSVTAALFLVAMLVAQLILGGVSAAITASPAREIVASLAGLLRANLLETLVVGLFVGLVVALGAYLAGRPEWLMRLRPKTDAD